MNSKKNGILIEGYEKKRRTSQQEKYEFLMQLADTDEETRKNATMHTGLSYQSVKHELQNKYNSGTSQLTPEQIQNLRKYGLLNYSTEEKEKLSAKYGFPFPLAKFIEEEYGSKDKFMQAYKKGECDYSFDKEFFCGEQKVCVSDRPITQQQKKMYITLLTQQLITKEELKNTKVIHLEYLQEALEQIVPADKIVIEKLYGLEDGKRRTLEEVSQMLGISQTIVNKRRNKGIRKISHPRRMKNIFRDGEGLKKIIETDIPELEELKDFEELKCLDIEKLDLSIRTIRALRKNGIHTINSLEEKTETELQMRGIGRRALDEINAKIQNKDKIKEAQKKQQEAIKELESYQLRAEIAEEYYWKEENVFDPESIIPSINELIEKKQMELDSVKDKAFIEKLEKAKLQIREPKNLFEQTQELVLEKKDDLDDIFENFLVDYEDGDAIEDEIEFDDEFDDEFEKYFLEEQIFQPMQQEEQHIETIQPVVEENPVIEKTVELQEEVMQEEIILETTNEAEKAEQENLLEDLSDEELDKLVEDMQAQQQEKERKLERLKKEKRAKELILLSKMQDKEIAALEEQLKSIEANEVGEI